MDKCTPNVDILIRTGGEKRLSNFMTWQCAHATLYFLDKYWPEITRKDIEQIVRKFTAMPNFVNSAE